MTEVETRHELGHHAVTDGVHYWLTHFHLVILHVPTAHNSSAYKQRLFNKENGKQRSFTRHTKLLADSLQCYCGEIRRMLTLHANLCCPKLHHRPDYSIHITLYYRKILLFLNPTPSTGLEPCTILRFVTFATVISPLKQTIMFPVEFFYHA
jgi:hypothetical protein